jgi:hypothetical protein
MLLSNTHQVFWTNIFTHIPRRINLFTGIYFSISSLCFCSATLQLYPNYPNKDLRPVSSQPPTSLNSLYSISYWWLDSSLPFWQFGAPLLMMCCIGNLEGKRITCRGIDSKEEVIFCCQQSKTTSYSSFLTSITFQASSSSLFLHRGKKSFIHISPLLAAS